MDKAIVKSGSTLAIMKAVRTLGYNICAHTVMYQLYVAFCYCMSQVSTVWLNKCNTNVKIR